MHFSDNNYIQKNTNVQHSCCLSEKALNCSEQVRNIASCNKCNKINEVGTNRTSWGLTNHPLASVYSPLQDFDNLYDCENALIRGTIFKELDLPFRGLSVAKGGYARD